MKRMSNPPPPDINKKPPPPPNPPVLYSFSPIASLLKSSGVYITYMILLWNMERIRNNCKDI